MIYRRQNSDWIGPAGVGQSSINYWRAQARRVFGEHPAVEAVEIVESGRASDSAVRRRGAKCAPAGWYVIVASTGGRWGRSRRDYHPAGGAAE